MTDGEMRADEKHAHEAHREVIDGSGDVLYEVPASDDWSHGARAQLVKHDGLFFLVGVTNNNPFRKPVLAIHPRGDAAPLPGATQHLIVNNPAVPNNLGERR